MADKTSVPVFLMASVVVGRGDKATTITPKRKGERVFLDETVAKAVVDAGAGTYAEAEDDAGTGDGDGSGNAGG